MAGLTPHSSDDPGGLSQSLMGRDRVQDMMQQAAQALQVKSRQMQLQYTLYKSQQKEKAAQERASVSLPCFETVQQNSPIFNPTWTARLGEGATKVLEDLVFSFPLQLSPAEAARHIADWAANQLESGDSRMLTSQTQDIHTRIFQAKPNTEEPRSANLYLPIAEIGEIILPSEVGDGYWRGDLHGLHKYLVVIVMSGFGEVIYWNEKMTQATGIEAATAIGQDIAALMPLAEHQAVMKELIEMAENESHNFGPARNLAFQRSDGVNLAHLELTVSGGRNIVVAMGKEAGTEVSDLFVQWSLDQLLKQLRDLRQELGGGNSPSSSQSSLCPAPLDTETCLKLTQRMDNIASSCLSTDTTAWGPLQIRTVLNKLVVDTSKQMASERNVEISLHFETEIPQEIYTDRLQLRKAVGYVLFNAVRFSPAQETVTVSVASIEEEGCAMGTLRIIIEDNGPGIPLEVLTSLDQATSSDESKGLADTVAVIRELGGTVSIEQGRVRKSAVGGEEFGGIPIRAASPNPGTKVTIDVPLLIPSVFGIVNDDLDHSNSKLPPRPLISKTPKELEERRAELASKGQSSLIKCLLVESRVVYKMSFCHHLWERCYFLIHANSLEEVLPKLDAVDMLVVDVEDLSFEVMGLLETLMNSNSPIQGILASSLFNPDEKKRIKEANWHAVTLPLNAVELRETLDEVEIEILKARQKELEIKEVRKAFEGVKDHTRAWERGKVLGKGNFGTVYEANMLLTGGKMAVKAIPLDKVKSEPERQELIKEVKVMSTLQHPNIVHYFYSELQEQELLIFMELCDGTLGSRVPKGGMDANTASGYIQDILRGLGYLHSKGLVHRDIKVGNVLLSKGVCKLTDFGTAMPTETGDEEETLCEGGKKGSMGCIAGTPQYMAPEILDGTSPTVSADIWALGCLLMEISTGKPPFAHKGEGWVAIRYVSKLAVSSEEPDLGPFPYHDDVRSFLRLCLQTDYTKRPKCDELLQKPFIRINDLMARKATVLSLANARRESMRAMSFQRKYSHRRAQAANPAAKVPTPSTAVPSAPLEEDDDSSISGWGACSCQEELAATAHMTSPETPSHSPTLLHTPSRLSTDLPPPPERSPRNKGRVRSVTHSPSSSPVPVIRSPVLHTDPVPATSTSLADSPRGGHGSICSSEEEGIRKLADMAVNNTLAQSFCILKPPQPLRLNTFVESPRRRRKRSGSCFGGIPQTLNPSNSTGNLAVPTLGRTRSDINDGRGLSKPLGLR